ncbi:type II toxin-antitoxin system VapB family antitoxin [Beijerinckia indica]|uniref:Rv0623 family protein transcription factor n=1 Tax=Beijerinckia indica subsp. indica (strain ATCC 9039 / DSM 1715 / NCIMB 8712) TaxID=395963 RepID=B2IL59_BEII9|nr:type II toxin-antitoxin system VapB family antitoxin [Beijerinckia indica]ACB97259.1 Rv0623 family protein transcription factor [Beijerinckia indica subsp. indica ATCC 9039]
MPLFIKDASVDELAAELAHLLSVNKTEAVRLALRQALDREKATESLAEQAVRFCRDLRARSHPERGQPADKAFFDELNGGL